MMRMVKNPQLQFGQIDIADIEIDLKSRDDIPHILLGLQHIYTEPKLHDEVFEILKKVTPKRRGRDLNDEERNQPADSSKGRPGMEQWTILVLGVLRVGFNTDYDRVHELANQHQTVRKCWAMATGVVTSSIAYRVSNRICVSLPQKSSMR